MGTKIFEAGSKRDMYWFDPEDLILINSKLHPLYDPRVEEPVEEAMVKNMMYNNQGVLEPVIICKEEGRPIVVAGRKRVKAAREACKRLEKMGGKGFKVPTIYKRGDEKDLYSMLITENEQRVDDGVLGKAEKLKAFLNLGGTKKEAAEAFGVSAGTISNWDKLLDLTPKVKKLVSQGKLSASQAANLAGLEKEEQNTKAEEISSTVPDGQKAKVSKTKNVSTAKTRKSVRSFAEVKAVIEAGDIDLETEAILKWFIKDDKHKDFPYPEMEEE